MSGRAVTLAGETVLLLPEKAVYWPRHKMLIIADIHFGKAAAFRAQGVPVPRGTTSENLAGLDRLMSQNEVAHILFLGDFLHARAAHASATLTAMLAWRARHPALQLTLVRGNHDKHAGDPAAALAIHMVDEPHVVDGFAFCHHPDIAAPAYVMAGHVHPVFVLSSRLDSLRLPCFLAGETRMILPSFGAFTGGHPIQPVAGEQVFVSSGEAIHCVR
ncbi:ligase-associated DNA damage response endonuclease PdeM [Massilia sp. CF038]|uniref:ligase-associated DNA damage response endonuclease PdeM n=1 Tax=Massilia sp. CF038 TaxID=1881045 RepID=UPI00091A6947|nr:ligase-associated DNA damage response endonuclease PdeM [Massilia sp. CF038]SHG49793.1 putative phosphoesterase [Massilia sp. CF038]